MYSNKENINILTALLVKHGVENVVVCPGSRNAPLVHNFNECPEINCIPATDERSAGFVALGLRQQAGRPVAVCVTSGSALLNLAPAAIEANYRQVGIIIISADRPGAWIGQLDGQTMPQQGALGASVAMSVNLPEPESAQEPEYKHNTLRWECNRLINEALMENARPSHPSVHINVPVSEPLFEFNTENLPDERAIHRMQWSWDLAKEMIIRRILSYSRTMVVIGQLPQFAVADDLLEKISHKITVLAEPASAEISFNYFTDQMLYVLKDIPEDMKPECVIYLGGNTISKRLRQFLRKECSAAFHIVISEDGVLHDISTHTSLLIEGTPGDFLSDLNRSLADNETPVSEQGSALLNNDSKVAFYCKWEGLRKRISELHDKFVPEYSQMLAVKLLEQRIKEDDIVHYANSMSVRLGEIYAKHYINCNRGLNGIEGSLSTFAGAAIAQTQAEGVYEPNICCGNESGQADSLMCKVYGSKEPKAYCAVGDLSFFYDHNALWLNQLGGNARIMLLNNGQGGIFKSLKGLEVSPAAEAFVAGKHNLSAKGICSTFGVKYLKAVNSSELEAGIKKLASMKSERPVLLEVFTDADKDIEVYAGYYKQLRSLNTVSK